MITFCLFATGLGAVFASAVYISLDYLDDYLVDSRLQQEMLELSRAYQRPDDALVSSSPNIQVYIGTQSMPKYVARMVQGFGEGIHETYHDDTEFHIAVKTVSGRVAPLYLIFDVSALEFTETRKLRIGFILLAGVALVVGLGSWIGVLLSRRVIAPVAHLADRVKHLEPENLPDRLSQSFTDDEVGVLAKYMEQAVARIGSFVRRERQFTRDASHELRTPVTVIKGAVVLIETQLGADTKSILRPLARIKRAVADMENLIETFLWLGRKESLEPYDGRCEVVPIVEQVINQTRHMFADKPVEVELHTAAEPVLAVPPTAFQAVVANLIKNAFQATSQGKIAVSVCDDHLAITDTGHGIAACDLHGLTQPYVRGEKSVGFGLGLTIVKRLCRRFGWRFTLSGDTAQGTVAALYFKNVPAAADQTGSGGPPPDR